jgi:hypothetical protein
MILASTLLSALGAIVLSETLGRGKVVYTRMLSLIASYLVCCLAAGLVMARRGGGPTDIAAVALSGVPLMAAWLGFRIHLSNSITLEMAGLFEDGRARSVEEIARDPARGRLPRRRCGGHPGRFGSQSRHPPPDSHTLRARRTARGGREPSPS